MLLVKTMLHGSPTQYDKDLKIPLHRLYRVNMHLMII